MTAELIEDREIPGAFRVEAIDEDGGCEIAIFSGPGALARATSFATGYYKALTDPDALMAEHKTTT